MGKASGALVGALAIGGVAAALGATHSIFVPVRLSGGAKPPPAAEAAGTPADGADATDAGTTDAGAPSGDGPGMSPIGVAGREDPVEAPASHAWSAFELIDLDRAKSIWDEGVSVFIDARPDHEYVEGHIPGAFWMPASEVSGAMIFEIEKWAGGYDGAVVIYCVGGDCDASENVAIRLQESGFTNLLIMREGFKDWSAAGYDVETGEPPEIGG